MLKKMIFWLVLLLCLGPAGSAFGGQVTLAWDANTEPDLAGYKMYYGTATGMYGTPINVGNVLTYTVNGLTNGVTYYFAVTAYDTFGNESGYSNEVFYTPYGDVAVVDTTPPSNPRNVRSPK